jgi:hypothetical protein
VELLGLAEVSELLGWDKRKTSTYLKRGVLPEPIHIIKATPLWTREQIETYKEKMKNKVKPQTKKSLKTRLFFMKLRAHFDHILTTLTTK